MARIFALVAVLLAIAAVSVSSVPKAFLAKNELEMDFSFESANLDKLKDEKIGIPTEELVKALQVQYDDKAGGRSGANLFNFSSYLQTNRPNGTALTFVPLITFLLALVGGGTPTG